MFLVAPPANFTLRFAALAGTMAVRATASALRRMSPSDKPLSLSFFLLALSFSPILGFASFFSPLAFFASLSALLSSRKASASFFSRSSALPAFLLSPIAFLPTAPSFVPSTFSALFAAVNCSALSATDVKSRTPASASLSSIVTIDSRTPAVSSVVSGAREAAASLRSRAAAVSLMTSSRLMRCLKSLALRLLCWTRSFATASVNTVRASSTFCMSSSSRAATEKIFDAP